MERDYAIITLFLNCGMRLSELIGINITDIVRNNSTIDKRQFELKLNEFINGADVIRAEFPSTMRWFKFASANK